MFWFGKNDKHSDFSDVDVSVTIFDTVEKRIQHVISNSQIEEGGKFIGKIERPRKSKLLITVENYIDSGPRVDNSQVQLLPDVDYQEKIFRILEIFDSSIDFIGTWHSHHCNGLPHLSDGDIQGYFEMVNNSRYKVEYFFVLLVTGLKGYQLEKKYYLFRRGEERYFELSDDSEVKFIHEASKLEPILQVAEEMSFANRNSGLRYNHSSTKTKTNVSFSSATNDPLQKVRSEDYNWILEHYPDAKLFRTKNDGSLEWKWSIKDPNLDVIIKVKYKYLSNNYSNKQALLDIHKISKGAICTEKLQLDSTRFEKITQHIDEATNRCKASTCQSAKEQETLTPESTTPEKSEKKQETSISNVRDCKGEY